MLANPNILQKLQALSPPTVTWAEQGHDLREMWFENTPTEEIAQRLGRSANAVLTQAARMGLPRRVASGRKGRTAAPRLPDSGGMMKLRMDFSARAQPMVPVQSMRKERQCLMCSTAFQSSGAHNRICQRCKAGVHYQSIGDACEYEVLTG